LTRLPVAVAVLSVLLAGCGGGAGSGAPEILYGEETCDRCRMVISERRHAAGARLDGRDYRFDDPGCLRGFLDSEEGSSAGAAWVHDETESWRPAQEAWFVEDPERRTPMASGILAFGSAAAAAAAAESYRTEPLHWTSLRGRSETTGR